MKKKIDKKKVLEKGNGAVSEFKEFISQGNVLDMAVGVIIGAAFGKIVTSVVNDILMPIIGILIGGIDFTGLSFKVGKAVITYGNFIQNVIDFLIVALCIFIFVKIIRSINKKQEAKEKKEEEIVKKEETILLEEIRDLLKKRK